MEQNYVTVTLHIYSIHTQLKAPTKLPHMHRESTSRRTAMSPNGGPGCASRRRGGRTASRPVVAADMCCHSSDGSEPKRQRQRRRRQSRRRSHHRPKDGPTHGPYRRLAGCLVLSAPWSDARRSHAGISSRGGGAGNCHVTSSSTSSSQLVATTTDSATC